MTDLVRKYIEEENFSGIKIYPPLGYFPDDERLFDLYRYAVEHDLPVLGHTMPAAPFVHARSFFEARWKVFSQYHSLRPLIGTRRQVGSYFAHPNSYMKLLETFNTLKLCLAHGGNDFKVPVTPFEKDWDAFVVALLRNSKYEKLYVDISFSSPDDDLIDKIEVLLDDEGVRDRILFGSDYYMNVLVADEASLVEGLKERLGEAKFNLMANENPRRFLGSRF